MTVTDPYTGIGVITRGVFDSDMAAISLSLHSSCNDIALNEKNSPSFCQIHFYRGIFHLLSSCTLSTLRAFNSSSFHPSSPQIHPFSMIPVTPHRMNKKPIPYPQGVRVLKLPAGALSSRTDERLETILMRQENPRVPLHPNCRTASRFTRNPDAPF